MSEPKKNNPLKNARVMPLEEAIKTYQLPQAGDHLYDGMENNIYVFEADAFFDKLDLDALFYDAKHNGAIFLGNLTVEEYIFQRELDYGPFTYVKGTTTAKNIYLGGGHTHLHGNVTVTQSFLAGSYNHGYTSVDGTIEAEVLFCYDHGFEFTPSRLKKGYFLTDIEDNNIPVTEPNIVLQKKYWDKEDQRLLTDKLLAAMKAGKSVIESTKSVPPLVSRLEKAKQSKNKRADLSKLRLKALPAELLQWEDVQQLNLAYNPITTIGTEITQLKQLKVLELESCELETFPEAITQLTELEQLDLTFNPLSELPSSFASLQQLKKLYLANCMFQQLPETLSHLPNLEVLNADFQRGIAELDIKEGFSQLKELTLFGDLQVALPKLERLSISLKATPALPASITGCKKLKKLDIKSARYLKGFPDELANLKQLDELSFYLHNKFDNIAVLQQLPKLKTLFVAFDYWEPIPDTFAQLLEIPQWSVLYINGFFKDEALIKQILSRTNLTKLVMVYQQGQDVVDIENERKWLNITI
ncbi:Leucine rich repeat-containing protein [Filimonas lacunae]|uniref:Leucine rich repeat-containing protein n=1 Tax=Filimonas lacunae TaxID=477680 RepID=A0A173MKF6_9BACT|nr:leucine-rich repeat domain-containing protein [Filimonas lacunae]BAV07949.1 serine/threonine protein kinase [Filimonas lacunae]SIT07053.1 Leucine rich repeat-containing protein [Filimonas lacunae]